MRAGRAVRSAASREKRDDNRAVTREEHANVRVWAVSRHELLDGMANREGKLDPALTKLFIESRCWEADIERTSRGPDSDGR